MEIPTIPKVVLDNLLGNMGSPATFKEVAPLVKQNNGFRQLPVPPLFHGSSLRPPAMGAPSKAPAVSLPPLPGGSHMRDLATISAPNLFKDCADPLAKNDLVKEKPKRVRKSRAGASLTKSGTADSLLDTNIEVDQQLHVPPPKRRRPSAKLSGDAEMGEKPPPRKRNRSKAKAKEEQLLSFSTNETSFGHSNSVSCKGILGMYGLETKALDLSRYMKDISVESLIAGDINVPPECGKQSPPSGSIIENSFGSNVSFILQNLTRPVNTDQARPVPLFSKPMESKPIKFSLDLESSPTDESEECPGVDLFEPKVKAPQKESSTPFLRSRKTHEAPSLFSLETIPVIPPADFWNSLQIQTNASLSSLFAQASTATDSRYFPSEVRPNYDKFSALPPSIFSLGSSHMPQESSGDRFASSKLNQWFRAEPPKQDSPEVPHHFVAFSRASTFPFKLEIESDPLLTKPIEKTRLKEGLLDIDLNKQSPEAEAAESIAHSTSAGLSGPQALNEVPVHVQATASRCDTDNEPRSVQTGLLANASTPRDEVKAKGNINTMMDHEDLDHMSELRLPLQHISETVEKSSGDAVVATVNKQQSSEQTKVVSINISSSVPTLIVPDVPDSQDTCSTDMPYSPGMQATALLLCKMANSLSPFYNDRYDEHTLVAKLDGDPYTERPSVTGLAEKAKFIGLAEKEASGPKRADLHANWNEEYIAKAEAKEGRDKSLFSFKGSSNGHTTEPWASTPPRHAPKNVASRMSGSQSSESDRSPPAYDSRERRSHGHGVLGNVKKLQKEKQFGIETSCKVASLGTRKDVKGNPKPVSKTSFLHTLPTKGSSGSSQKRTLPVEAKQSSTVYGDGLTKVSRPRSNISKNCIESQRSTNSYPVQIGCSIKTPTSRHVLPFAGEVRHGSK